MFIGPSWHPLDPSCSGVVQPGCCTLAVMDQSTRVAALVIAGIALAGVTGCRGGARDDTSAGAPPAPVIDPGDGGDYRPIVDPSEFVDRIDNPYLPMLPGARWVYEEASA